MRLLLSLVFSALLSGCIMTRLDHVETEPNFNWDVLKRDEIVITPLLDLRVGPSAEVSKFFSQKEQEEYAEKFKQEFFKTRKDIRVYGAGGAFEKLKNVPQLAEIAHKVLKKEPLTEAEQQSLEASTQDIRFIFFFTVPDEHLQQKYQTFKDDDYIHHVYKSTRNLQVKLALYDLKEKRTPWIGTANLQPTNENDIKVARPKKKKDGKGFTFFENSGTILLTAESQKYPSFPGREPALSNSFDDFVLGLPLHPSEDKSIEYESFTYHRPELSMMAAPLGDETSFHLDLAFSSIIYNKFRLGALIGIPMNTPRVTVDGKKFKLGSAVIAVTADYEVPIATKWRLLTGVYLGTELFNIYDEQKNELAQQTGTQGPDEETATADATLFAWPRIKLLYGNRTGFNVGIAAFYRKYWGIEEKELQAHAPGPWAIEFSIGGTFRGY